MSNIKQLKKELRSLNEEIRALRQERKAILKRITRNLIMAGKCREEIRKMKTWDQGN